MLATLAEHRRSLAWITIGYFVLHVVIRANISDALSFDESEQVFLSQWLHWGYNSQPPLYTWLQTALFATLGYSIWSLAILKNGLLLATYWLLFATVRRTGAGTWAAAIASAGMLTMPQIAWESHRDLSHTVAVTAATALLFFSIVRLKQSPTAAWYFMLGVACGLGLMSKYNFAMTIVAVLIASATIPRFRARIADARIAISIMAALLILGPHLIWMIEHPDLVSSKTVSQLTPHQPLPWIDRVTTGAADLMLSTAGCIAITVILFIACFWNGRLQFDLFSSKEGSRIDDSRTEDEADLLGLIERFLLAITVMLILLVFSGAAVKIKNHWLHPYIFLLPCYLTLRLRSFGPLSYGYVNRVFCSGLVCGSLVLIATVVKPLISASQPDPSLIHLPYASLADEIVAGEKEHPSLLIASNMRVAGNLRLQFPDVPVISMDHPHLGIDHETTGDLLRHAVLVSESDDPATTERLNRFASDATNRFSTVTRPWQAMHFPYGSGDQKKTYFLSTLTTNDRIQLSQQPSDASRAISAR